MSSSRARTRGAALCLSVLCLAFPAAGQGRSYKVHGRLRDMRSWTPEQRRAARARIDVREEAGGPSAGVLIRVKPGTDKARLRSLFPRARFNSEVGGVVTAVVPLSMLDDLESEPGIESVHPSVKVEPELSVVRSGDMANGYGVGVLPGGLREVNTIDGTGVVIGFVDTGIDWTHKDFRQDPADDTSRILAFWDQTYFGAGSSHPKNYNYGSEWSRQQITAELQGGPGIVKSSDTVGHGTHVAAIAAGDGSDTDGHEPAGTYKGMAPGADIVMVKTDFYTASILDGMNYIISTAAAQGKRAVINLSLGTQDGPHDGTDALEAPIGVIAQSTPVVKSAGNDGANAVHAYVDLSVLTSTTVDVTPLYNPGLVDIEFWHPGAHGYDVTVRTDAGGGDVIAPYGNNVQGTRNGHLIKIWNATNSGHPQGDKQIYVEVTASPITATRISVGLVKAAGRGQGVLNGFTSGSGSVFCSHNDGGMSISAPGNANNIITVGAYCSKYHWHASNNMWYVDSGSPPSVVCDDPALVGLRSGFSARGPTRDGRTKPDLVAPGQVIASALSSAITELPSNTTFDGRHRIMRGTSMSAPVVTGAIALMLQVSPTLTATQVRSRLQSKARTDGATGSVPNYSWGYGRLTASPPLTAAPVMSAALSTAYITSVTWAWTNAAANNTTVSVHSQPGDASVSGPLAYAQTSWTENGLTPDTDYTRSVTASNSADDRSSTAITTKTYAAPPIPLTPSPVTPTSITANWNVNGNPGYTNFYAERATDAGFTAGLANSGWSTASSYLFSGLAVNTTYYLRVRARNGNGVETAAMSLNTTPTRANPPVAAAPAQAFTSSVTVSWGLNGDPGPGVTEFTAERALDSGFSAGFAGSGWVTGTSYPFTGLSPNTTYYFRARARNHAGLTTTDLDLGTALTLASAPVSAVPLDLGPDYLIAAWGGANNPSGTEYYAELATNPGFAPVYQAGGWTTGLSQPFGALTPNTTYYVRVRARNSAFVETAPTGLPITPTMALPPGADTAAFVSTGSFVVRWTGGGNPVGTLYHAERALDAAFTSGVAGTTTTALSWAVSGLTPNATHYLRVHAINFAGGATVPAALPPAVTNAQNPAALEPTAVLDAQFAAHWGTAANPPGTQYYAQRAQDTGYTADVGASGWIDASSFTFRGLSLNTTYYSRVKARSFGGAETNYVDLPSTLTLPFPATAPPEDIHFTMVGITSMTAAWTLLSPAESPLWALATSSSFAAPVSSQTGAPNQQSVTFTTLTPNATHWLKIKVSTANDYFYSDALAALTRPDSPLSDPAADVTPNSILASWESNGNAVGTRYLVEMASNPSFTAGLTSSPWITAVTYNFTGLSVNTSHYFQVRARGWTGVETPVVALPPTSTKSRQPSPLASSDYTPYAIRANWDPLDNTAGTQFLAERMEGSVVVDASQWITSSSHVFTSLTPNATFYFYVRSRNWDGASTPDRVVLPPSLTLAEQPANAPATGITTYTVAVNWLPNGNPNGTEYQVEVSSWPGYAPDVLTSPWTTSQSAAFAGLERNTIYNVHARARNAALVPTPWQPLSPVATMALPPTPLATTPYSSSATVRWGANGNPSGTTYQAQYSTSSDFSPCNETGWVTYTAAVLDALYPNTSYYFRVKARNFQGLETSTVALPSTLTQSAPPGAGLPPVVWLDRITFYWDGSANPPGTSYYAERSLNPQYSAGLANSGWVTTTGATFAGLSVNTSYYLRVKSKNAADIESGWSDLSPLSTLSSTPTALVSGAYDHANVALSWQPNGNPAGTEYQAWYSRGDDFSLPSGAGWIASPSTVVPGLTPNTRYYFRVQSRDRDGTPSDLTPAPYTQVVTLATTAVSASPTSVFDDSVVLHWASNGNPVWTVYYAELATDAGFTQNLRASGWTNDTKCSFAGLTPSTLYYARVKAGNLDSMATQAIPLPSFTTPANAPVPRSVNIPSVTTTQLTASWRLLSPGELPVYQLSRASDFSTLLVSASGAVDQQTATFSQLSPNTTYYFRVRLSTTTDEYYSIPVASATLPNLPASPAACAGSTAAVCLQWSANGNAPGTVYEAQVSSDDFVTVIYSSWTKNLSAPLTGSGETLTPNTRYYARVRATHHGGAPTSPLPSLPIATLSYAPSAVVPGILSVTYSSVTARWQPLPPAPPSATAQGYALEASTAPDFSGALARASQAGQASKLAVEGLSVATTYYLRVGALNIDGIGNYLVLGSTTLPYAATGQALAGDGQAVSVSIRPGTPQILEVTVSVPAGALPAGVPILVNSGVLFSQPPLGAQAGQLTSLGAGVGVEISAGGNQPTRPVLITMDYDPAKLSAGADPAALVIARWDADAAKWVVLPGSVDTRARTVTGLTTHFSPFAPFLSAAAATLDSVLVSPVPWEPGSGTQFDWGSVVFSSLPKDARVQIFTLLGEKVFDAQATASGFAFWDGTNLRGHKVGSGTYLAVVKGAGRSLVRRVVVMR